uniref:Uncharacterized protein n=1 Tax=Anguilla anguilla TaxID=7936 RepID=A0A0E9XBA5_ANGAN
MIRMSLTEHSNADVTITAGNRKQWSSRTRSWNFEKTIPKKTYSSKGLDGSILRRRI